MFAAMDFLSQMNSTINLVSSLQIERIEVQSEISSSKRILETIASLLTKGLNGEVREKDIYHQLLEREKLGNTGVGDGVAIPHSRCAYADEAIVALITLNEPVDYDSIDRKPVDVVFGLLVPQEATQDHLNLLAEIARLMSNPRHKAALASSKSEDEAMSLIKTWAKA